ncbi:hypothetical protein MTO96_004628 [Rhipicephalus appendiculatus]
MLGHPERTEQIAFVGRPSKLVETNADWAQMHLLGHAAHHEDRARCDRVKTRRLRKGQSGAAAAAVAESIGTGIGDTYSGRLSSAGRTKTILASLREKTDGSRQRGLRVCLVVYGCTSMASENSLTNDGNSKATLKYVERAGMSWFRHAPERAAAAERLAERDPM